MITPFDNDPKHYDVMICRLKTAIDSRAGGRILECGTQGWFNMQRSIYACEMNVGVAPRWPARRRRATRGMWSGCQTSCSWRHCAPHWASCRSRARVEYR